MNRFEYGKTKKRIPKSLLSICVFFVVLLCFFQGITNFSSDTQKRQRESLENALTRSVTYCYTVEGSYPPSLTYLQENYGLIYDDGLFFVDYQYLGANILPDITIIERGEP